MKSNTHQHNILHPVERHLEYPLCYVFVSGWVEEVVKVEVFWGWRWRADFGWAFFLRHSAEFAYQSSRFGDITHSLTPICVYEMHAYCSIS